MSKATCTKCKHIEYLSGKSPEGTDRWVIEDAVKYLINKMEKHKCQNQKLIL